MAVDPQKVDYQIQMFQVKYKSEQENNSYNKALISKSWRHSIAVIVEQYRQGANYNMQQGVASTTKGKRCEIVQYK